MLTHGAKLTTSLEHAWYGAQANEHFRYYDPNIAEGITLTGQLVIRFISNRVNDFLNDRLKTDGVDYVCANDTDSVVGDTIVCTSAGDILIQDLWVHDDQVITRGTDNYIRPITGLDALGYDKGCCVMKPVNYIMKHRVKKRMFKLKAITSSGETREVICTADHSLIVERDGDIVSVKPAEMQLGDVVILS